jgi:hypothetical protein
MLVVVVVVVVVVAAVFSNYMSGTDPCVIMPALLFYSH